MTTSPTLRGQRRLPGPTTQRERSLAPDLTRGAMLLFIALANAANCAFAGQPGLEPHPHGAERVVDFVMSLLVDSRAYPVFAIMFGYGLVQIHRRQRAGGSSRRALLRRNSWLVGFGLVHATLLYFGDFLAAYGIIGIAATLLLLNRSDRFHRVVLWLWGLMSLYLVAIPALVLLGGKDGSAGLTNAPNPSLSADSYLASIGARLTDWMPHTLSVLPMIVIVWLGIWAARRGVLDDVAGHRVLLRRVAVGGLGIAVLGGLPYALVAGGWLHADSGTVSMLSLLHDVSGEYAGPGYIAVLALVSDRLSRRPEVAGPVRAVAALGQRSMSGYLFQSVCWLVLFAPFALDLGGDIVVAVGCAAGVWLVSVTAAALGAARGGRGPAETVLRRLTYGPR